MADPNIIQGKLLVKETRITVELVVDYLARNPYFDDLLVDYARLTIEGVKPFLACSESLCRDYLGLEY